MAQATPSGETGDWRPMMAGGRAVIRSSPGPVSFESMEAFLVSTGLVALAEMGDKTQIATVVLGARYESLVQVVR